MMRMPAPSARTNPSRSRSNGRLARVGSSFRVDRARIAANPPRPMWVIAASLPPVIMMSARPFWISLNASPMALAAEAQAVATAEFGPLQAPADRDLAAGGVDHQLGDRERADPRRPLLHHRRVLGLELVETADPRADDHAARYAAGRSAKSIPASATADIAGRHGELREPVEVPRLLDAEPSDRVPVANLAAELDLELGRIEEGQRPDAAPARAERRPESGSPATSAPAGRDHAPCR